MPNELDKTKRRLWQISLLELLLGALVVGLGVGWWADHKRTLQIHQQATVQERLESLLGILFRRDAEIRELKKRLAILDRGELTGRFIYGGDPPIAKIIPVPKDTAELGESYQDESLIVNETNKGIANVVIYLQHDGNEVDEHHSYGELNDAELILQGGRFKPRILLLRTNQTLVVRNKDKIMHGTATYFSRKNSNVNFLLPGSKFKELNFTQAEPGPRPVFCGIHPWMASYILLRSDPYMAKSDGDGRFNISNLPVGQHVFRVWHERAGFLRNVRIGSVSTSSVGRLKVDIQFGNNDLGSIVLRHEDLQKRPR